jgi:hypothetical protein
MENTVQNTAPTFESVWAALQETDRQMKENDRFIKEKFAESDRQRKENERMLTEKFAAGDRQMEKIRQTLGAWATNQGHFAEEYFFNSFDKGKQNFFGEQFDEIEKNIKGFDPKDEYDILLINGKSMGIIEVKFKAHNNDIEQVLRKAVTFRSNFPKYATHRIYLGLASMSFYPELEQKCIENGIAIIKQVGETVVINDEHLKTF